MKAKLTNICAALCAIMVSFVISSCALFSGDEGTVRDTVDNTMKIFKFAENSDAASFADQSTIDTLNAYGVDANEFLAYSFKNLEWEIGDIKINGDSGTAAVSITNTDLSAALERAGEQFATYSETDEAHQLFDEEGESALVKKLFGFYYEAIDSGEVATTTSNVTLEVYKDEEGTWQIKADNDALYKALYGGADFNV